MKHSDFYYANLIQDAPIAKVKKNSKLVKPTTRRFKTKQQIMLLGYCIPNDHIIVTNLKNSKGVKYIQTVRLEDFNKPHFWVTVVCTLCELFALKIFLNELSALYETKKIRILQNIDGKFYIFFVSYDRECANATFYRVWI